MTENTDDIPKAVLWSAPRCITTAFERSIRAHGDIKVYHEVYTNAAYTGEERFFPHFQDSDVISGWKFSDVKKLLESPPTGYRGVFAKENAYCIPEHRRSNALPDGYRHTFLIRQPERSVTSFHKLLTKPDKPVGWSKIHPGEVGFLEMWELYQYIRDTKGDTPLIIDADDLLSEPALLMQKYCNYVGFEFKESMLHWEAGPVEDWSWEGNWYDTVLKSSGFMKPSEKETTEPDVSSFPGYIQDAIRDARPYYEEMYKLRTKPCIPK
ncbi:uncharacterized protein [Ptychodera flava]|uniref:uncharacterized protein n=1 Tax=Ptychodera flava TaxID=63121 RepID=UPI003969D28F